MANTQLLLLTVAALVVGSMSAYTSGTGTATTTRYWDCCKVTCAWTANTGSVTSPVTTCAADGNTTVSADAINGCDGGTGFICNDLVPFTSGGQAYGFAAAKVNGLSSQDSCCACYKLSFTSAPLAGQTMIVQLINTGNDLVNNQFDLQIPAGGEGYFTQGCPRQWSSTPASAWGAQYGGVSSRAQCSAIPSALQAGCEFRFDWFQGADNPAATFERVACPSVLTDRSGCKRNDD